jgi:hypothetical protein
VQWATGLAESNPRIYLVHGEIEAMRALQTRLSGLKMRVAIPTDGDTIGLVSA